VLDFRDRVLPRTPVVSGSAGLGASGELRKPVRRWRCSSGCGHRIPGTVWSGWSRAGAGGRCGR